MPEITEITEIPEIPEIFNKNKYQNVLNIYGRFMHLSILIDKNDYVNKSDYIELKNYYKNVAVLHNEKILKNLCHIDAGFDLFLPHNINTFYKDTGTPIKVNFGIKCAATIITELNMNNFNTGFYMYPRSSLSKTVFRLANATGIIDAGYRGNLIGMFDVIQDASYRCNFNKFDRIVQICAPSLIPIIVSIVDTVEELGDLTLSGTDGIGSTGK